MSNIIRVLVAKPGLDGHDRGAKVVARALRDAGFEVIYTGLHQTPEMIVNSAIQEDVDVVGLSILSGAHIPLVEAIMKLMKIQKVEKPIFVGGIIPADDAQLLKRKGVAAVFGPGANLTEIASAVRNIATGKISAGSAKKSHAPVKQKARATKKPLPKTPKKTPPKTQRAKPKKSSKKK